MGVTIGDEEANDNVDEKGELTSNVEEEEVLWEASEESKLEGSEERRIHCPYQYEMFPYHVLPVIRMNDKALQSAAFTVGSGVSSNPTHTHLS